MRSTKLNSAVTAEGDQPLPWHTFIATWFGGVFDGMDSSIFAMVLYPSLSDLLHTTSNATIGQVGSYIIAMFMVGWAVGAVFFGWLADSIGRAKTLTITILLYALFTGLCAAASTWWQLGLCRFLVGAGIGGEMGIGAVLLSECWPKKTRIFALSAQATSLGAGYLLTDGLNMAFGHLGWRYLFLAGVLPALLTVYMRLTLRDSELFHNTQKKIAEAKSKNKSDRSAEEISYLISPFKIIWNKDNRSKTLVVGILTSCAIITWWAVLSWIPAWINQITGTLAVNERSSAMLFKDIGLIMSGILGGFLIQKWGYKKCMSTTFALAFIGTLVLFLRFKHFTPMIFPCIMFVGFFAHVPFVLLWSYIPELYPTAIRSTAFGITYNMGRMLAALACLGSGYLINIFDGSYALAACSFASIYVAGAVAALFMPKLAGDMID